MAQKHKQRIQAKRMPTSATRKVPCAHITVLITRGGPQWVPYTALSAHLRREWDAFEQILLRLSDGRCLYISGSFNRAEGKTRERTVLKEGREEWTGMCVVTTAQDLHAVLVENPLTIGYGYLITERSLCEDEAMAVAKRHHRLWGGHNMDDQIIDSCPPAFCGIEECIDRDWFGLECRLGDYEGIARTIVDVLSEFEVM